jgi:hypothetical protein
MIARTARMKRTIYGEVGRRDLFQAGKHLVDSAFHDSGDAKYRAIVWTKISLRPGDNSDILEALGLIPTTHTPVHERTAAVATCGVCGWQSNPAKQPTIALASHTRARHRKPVSA